MSNDSSETKRLSAKIKARKEFLKMATEFSLTITRKLGEEVLYRQESCYTNIVRQLIGFAHFSFLTDTGQTMMGGDTVKIWYHPKSGEVDFKRSRPVLDIDWWAGVDEDCKINLFDEDRRWQTALRRVVKNAEKIEAKMREVKKNLKKQRLEKEKKRRQAAAIREEAHRLRL